MSEDLKKSKNFCVMPWVHVHVQPSGKVFPCCEFKSDSEFGNLNQDPLSAILDSERSQELKVRFLKDERPSECTRCWNIEDNGGTSLRNRMNQSHFDKTEKMLQKFSPANHLIQDLDIRFSNVCNFKCRSCGPGLSSSWVKDAQLVHKIVHDFDDNELGVLNLPESINEELNKFAPNLTHLYFAGGEPLMSLRHWKFLEDLVKSGQSKSIELEYNTNFSTLTLEKFDAINLWSSFKKVKIGASLDDFGPRAEYIRKGTKWSEIVKNRNLLKRQAENISLHASTTVSILNVHNICNFHRELVRQGFIQPREFAISFVTEPTYLSPLNQPKNLLDKCKTKIQEYIHEMEQNYGENADEWILGQFKILLSYLDSEFRIRLHEFRIRTLILDKIRGEDVKKAIPELSEVFEFDYSFPEHKLSWVDFFRLESVEQTLGKLAGYAFFGLDLKTNFDQIPQYLHSEFLKFVEHLIDRLKDEDLGFAKQKILAFLRTKIVAGSDEAIGDFYVRLVELSTAKKEFNQRDLSKIFWRELQYLRETNRLESPEGRKNTFCIFPFIELHASTSGEAKPCCDYRGSIEVNKEQWPLKTRSLTEVWNSKELQDLREQMLMGERPSGCYLCWQSEDAGFESRRQKYETAYKNWTQNLDLGSKAPMILDLHLSNKCNIKCRTCSPTNSTKWIAERVDYHQEIDQSVPSWLDAAKDGFFSWAESNPYLQDDISKFAQNLKSIEFFGGEPFLDSKQDLIVEKLVESGHSKNIRLAYHTNGTVFNEKLVVNFAKFKEVILHISVDGIDSRFEYMRNPAKWSQLIKNISKYREVKNIRLGITFTFSALNLYNLPETYKWFKKEYEIDVYINPLFEPREFNINTIPEQSKLKLKEHLYNFSREFPETSAKVVDICNQMESSKSENSNLELLYTRIKHSDKFRKDSYQKAFPEMAKLLGYGE